MRTLQVSKFYPPVLGGIESTAWELTEGLNRCGLRTDVLCSNQKPTTVTDRFAAGYDVVRAASLGMWLSTSMAPAMMRESRRMMRERDLVHVHMPDPMAAVAVWAARPNAAVVVHWHSDVVRQRKALKFYEPLQRWLLDRADAIVATSHAYADASAPLRPWRSKVAVIPIGISDNHSSVCSEKASAIRKRFRGRRMVFSLGRMTYYKGFDILIHAASLLSDNCVVVIGGEGELLDQFRALVLRLGLPGKVHLIGHIPDDDLPSYFEACDVFCMSSTVRAEAYGVAMLEAMVMGKPVVASDIDGSGVPWVNVDGETGLNVEVGRPRPLAEALTRLLGDEVLRQRLGAGARRRYLADFKAELMTRRTVELYEQVLSKRPA